MWSRWAQWSKWTRWEKVGLFSNVVIKVWCMLCCTVRWKFWVDFGDSCAKENLKVLCSGEKWTFSWLMCCGNGMLATHFDQNKSSLKSRKQEMKDKKFSRKWLLRWNVMEKNTHIWMWISLVFNLWIYWKMTICIQRWNCTISVAKDL